MQLPSEIQFLTDHTIFAKFVNIMISLKTWEELRSKCYELSREQETVGLGPAEVNQELVLQKRSAFEFLDS